MLFTNIYLLLYVADFMFVKSVSVLSIYLLAYKVDDKFNIQTFIKMFYKTTHMLDICIKFI